MNPKREKEELTDLEVNVSHINFESTLQAPPSPPDFHELPKNLVDECAKFLKDKIVTEDDPAYLVKFNMAPIRRFCDSANYVANNTNPQRPNLFTFANYGQLAPLSLINDFRTML